VKNITLLLLFTFALSTLAFGAKKYMITLKVKSNFTKQPIAGLKITTNINNNIQEIGFTDSRGEITIKSMKEKSFEIIIEDLKGIHENKTLTYSNSNLMDDVKTTHLDLTKEEEKRISITTNELYTDTSKLNQSKNIEEVLIKKASPKDSSEISKIIHENIHYPKECLEKNIQGIVYIKFIIQADGKITHVEVLNGVHPLLDEEAVKSIRYIQNWNPKTYKREPIKTQFIIPVHFVLN
jgi:TonB family protein